MALLRRICFGLTLWLFWILAPSLSQAADWPPIPPDDLHMTELPQDPGASALVLLREEIADDPHNNHSVYMRVKVLKDAGRRYADVEIPYSRRHFTVGDVSGRTIHPDGTIIPFQGQVFDKVVLRKREGPRKEEVRIAVKSFALPDVQVGSIFEYRYTLRYDDHSFFSPEWIVQDELFQREAHFKFIPYEGMLRLAHDRIGNGVAWTSFLPKDVHPVNHDVPRATYASAREASRWIDLQMSNIPPIVREPFMIPIAELRYRVKFYYMVGANQEDFWKEEGKYLSKEAENFINRRSDIDQVVNLTVAPADSPEQKLHKLYAYVAQLDNWTYNPQRPEQEDHALGIKINQGAEDVVRQHGGSHDDLNRLFVALARAAGFPASLIWVPSRDSQFFDPAFLSTSQLTAEIAIVKVDGKEVFLDPGSKYCPYGLLDWRYSNVKGPRQTDGKATGFGETPMPDYNHAMIQRLARITLSNDGKFEGTVKIGFYGLEAMDRRQEGGKTDATGRKKLLEDELRSWLPTDSDVSLTNNPDWTNAETHLAAEFKVSGPLLLGSGKRWILPAHLFQVNEHPRFSSSSRVNAIYFYYLTRELDEVHITFPPDMQIESLPAPASVRLDYALYKTDQGAEGSHAFVSRRDLVLGGVAFPPEMYKEVKGFFDKVKSGDDDPALIKSTVTADAH
jgi:hypothetical protein